MSDAVIDIPDAETTAPDQTNYLNMSDAEIMAAGAPSEEVPAAQASEAADAEDVEDAEEEGTTPEAETEDDADADEDDEAADEGADSATPADAQSDEVKPEATAPEADQAPEVKVDYEAEYKRLIAPFKANGREIQVHSAEDAIALMQMGANYNKKMAALKPNLKIMKLLENNGLMSEEKLSFLIDLDKKNPAAINKLVQESGIDPMDLDATKAGEYRPKIHAVDDREIDLDTVLDEIQDTPTYARTLDVVSQKWDGASKQVISQTPQLLKVINAHMESGIYDLISKEVESERMFGRLNGLSDIESYRHVGDAIQARGGFNHLTDGQVKTQPSSPVIVEPKPKKVEDDKLKDKRRAASSTKPVAPTTAIKDFNPLALSDEEFSKLADNRFR
jgi:hypothetical protein